jgi:hypothetical protein
MLTGGDDNNASLEVWFMATCGNHHDNMRPVPRKSGVKEVRRLQEMIPSYEMAALKINPIGALLMRPMYNMRHPTAFPPLFGFLRHGWTGEAISGRK